jgi:hypothetical protein
MAVNLASFRSRFAKTASAPVLVVVMVAVAVTAYLVTRQVAMVCATLWFDLSPTRPSGRLAISHRPDIGTVTSSTTTLVRGRSGSISTV